jgi:hypothetical protein
MVILLNGLGLAFLERSAAVAYHAAATLALLIITCKILGQNLL